MQRIQWEERIRPYMTYQFNHTYSVLVPPIHADSQCRPPTRAVQNRDCSGSRPVEERFHAQTFRLAQQPFRIVLFQGDGKMEALGRVATEPHGLGELQMSFDALGDYIHIERVG